MHLRPAVAVSTIVRPEILLMDEWLSVGAHNLKDHSEHRQVKMDGSAKDVCDAYFDA